MPEMISTIFKLAAQAFKKKPKRLAKVKITGGGFYSLDPEELLESIQFQEYLEKSRQVRLAGKDNGEEIA